MRRALALAERGRGTTQPNPVVGAVIVRDGRIVAEGFHRKAGEAHAEVNALAQLAGSPRGTTMYVTLEPCDHTGRTGPCTDGLLAARPARVVVGCRDPNPIVDGRGIARLRRAGIRVDVGCLEGECRAAIRAYAVWVREQAAAGDVEGGRDARRVHRSKADGATAARVRRAPIWITGPEARAAAHELRAAHDAILVGAGTIRADNPRLTVRGAKRRPVRQPLRVVLAGRRPLPARAHVFDDAAPTLTIDDPRGRVAPARALKLLAARGRPVGAGRGGRRDRRRLHHGRAGRSDRAVRRAASSSVAGWASRPAPICRWRARCASARSRSAPVGPDLLLTADVDRRSRELDVDARML